MDLFSLKKNDQITESSAPQPLAEQLRPLSLDAFQGLEAIFSRNKPLLEQLKSGIYPSLIFWGPPGSGKTTLANILILQNKSNVHRLNAIETGAKMIRELGEVARQKRIAWNERTLIFIDEIHRLNRAQQDVLLPFVEAGDFTLIGATTEKPSHSVNSALLSRCQLVIFKAHSDESLRALIEKAMGHAKIDRQTHLAPEGLDELVRLSAGDARRALNLSESLIFHIKSSEIVSPLEARQIQMLFEQAPLIYDKKGSAHYDSISALIKCMRRSEPDGAMYYLARMLEGGEDPLFIARRLVIFASEDVGNADPKALELTVAAAHAVEMIGLPECAINLAQATIYLASAPKSNRSHQALLKAQEWVRGSHKIPTEIKDQQFYVPMEIGFEKKIRAYLEWLKVGKP